ncbi:MAG TPA: hypothetical protein VIN56_02335 [Candidatus Dormibacteraeota bacterium]|jgi:hypothetical protein
MEPVRVHQHLELDDVLAFGMGAVDLVVLGGAVLISCWIYLRAGLPLPARLLLSAVALASGGLLGPGRVGDRKVRDLVLAGLQYLRRPRLRLTGVGE